MAVTGDFEQIKSKVRKITGRLSTNQLSESDLEDYINDFYQYDFPADLKSWNLKNSLSPIFGSDNALIPNQHEYTFDRNAFTNLEPPIYVGGYEIQLFQDIQEFYEYFSRRKRREILAVGNDITGSYSGTLTNVPILPGSLFISTLDNGNNSLHCSDNGSGSLSGDITAGSVDYETGSVLDLNWNNIIPLGNNIWAQSLTYTTGRPSAVLFNNNTLTFYPVPDSAYEVECSLFQVPDALTAGSEPLVREWWNMIAYGAALKIFAENGDFEHYERFSVIFDKYKRLAHRRTLQQLKTQRSATIYSQDGYNPTDFPSTV